MKRQCLQKFLSGFFGFCITLSFSISSFSAAFTGAYMTTETDPVTGQVTTVIKDVNPSGQTFSGSNVIEMNAFNNAPTLTNNTFNGSTDINPDFTSITSSGNAYNGSVDINYDGLGGTLDSNGDRFQSTTVTAESSDISISNGTFNGTTTINAQSVSLGSISQMDSLLSKIDTTNSTLNTTNNFLSTTRSLINDIRGVFYIINDNLNVNRPYDQQTTVTLINDSYGTVSYTPPRYTQYTYTVTDSGVTRNQVYKWGNLNNRLQWWLTNIPTALMAYVQYYVGNQSYSMYTFTPSANGEHYSLTSNSQNVSFRQVIVNRFDIIVKLLNYYCDRFFNWYYPLDNTLPEYWRYYNTDTAQSEDIGLAGLMYNISWYLGQMYVLQSASQSLDNMTDQVEAITDTLEEAEQKENAVISSISSGINSFAPDLTDIGAFKALSWTSNYLQQVFLALGTYGTVILVGLLLGVCMQFIGYFKYK